MKTKTEIFSALAMAVTAFVVYLLMQRFVLSGKLETKDYIIGGAVALGLVLGQLFLGKKKK